MTHPRLRFPSEWNSFRKAKARCNDPNDKDYKYYGGRGIQFKFSSFAEFLDHVGPKPAGFTLDRIKGEKHYEKGNVRWLSIQAQQRNRKDNLNYTHNGKTQCLTEWAEEVGIPYRTLYARVIRYGWSFEKSISEAVQVRASRRVIPDFLHSELESEQESE